MNVRVLTGLGRSVQTLGLLDYWGYTSAGSANSSGVSHTQPKQGSSSQLFAARHTECYSGGEYFGTLTETVLFNYPKRIYCQRVATSNLISIKSRWGTNPHCMVMASSSRLIKAADDRGWQLVCTTAKADMVN